MKHLPPLVLTCCLGLQLAGCASVNLWPFGGEKAERSRTPVNATAYQCEGGRKLYVRLLDDGAAAWVILPERELRLEKSGAATARTYSYRSTVLEMKDTEATLFEGPKAILFGCKSAAG